MKRGIIIVIALVGFSMVSFAQQSELKSAQTNIEGKKYIAALDDLNKAKKAVTELISTELSGVLPAKFGEMEIYINPYGGGRMESQGVSVTKSYKKQVAKKAEESGDGERSQDSDMGMMDPMSMENQEEITVTVTTNMMMASEVMNAHSMAEDNMGSMNGKSEPVRINGYRALLTISGGQENEEDASTGRMDQPYTERAMVIVGGAFITVEARGLKEKGQAEKFVKLIDFAKLKGIVGE